MAKEGSSRRGKRAKPKEEHIVRYDCIEDVPRGGTDWRRFDALTDEEVEAAALADPDAQPTTAEFWKNARLVMPEPKQGIHIRLDPDVLSWFKKRGKGYQTRINAVLRAYVQAQK